MWIGRFLFGRPSKVFPDEAAEGKNQAICARCFSGRWVKMDRKSIARNAVDLFAATDVDFSDALILAEIQANSETKICSFDRDFDKVEGVKRMEA